MKKIIFSLLISALSLTSVSAAETHKVADNNGEGYFYAGLGTGADIPSNNWNSNFYVGSGANVFLGYQADENWSAQLNADEWFFTGSGYSLLNIRTIGEIKYSFAAQGWQPYLLAGAGTVFQTITPGAASTANFDALGGLGVQFDVAPRTHIFIEAKYNFIISQVLTSTDVPLSAGLWVGF